MKKIVTVMVGAVLLGQGSAFAQVSYERLVNAIHNAGIANPCGSDTQAPCDDDSHGTATASLVVGDDGAGNQIGLAPGARWIACRNMDQGNGTPASYSECFQFAV